MMRRRSGGEAVGGPDSGTGRVVLTALMVVVAIACRPPGRPAAGLSGQSVIESAAPLWAPGRGLALSDAPVVVIDSFTALSDAVRLHDGRIVVADAAPVALRYYSATGRHLYDAGGAEDGLDALRGVSHLSVGRADTVAVYEFARSALVLFDPNGGHAATLAIQSDLVPAGAIGLLPKGIAPDGRYLLQSDETRYPFPLGAGALLADSTRLYWLARDGAFTDSTARLFMGESFGFEAKGSGGTTTLLPLSRPLGASLHVASGASGVWIGDASAWELHHLDPHGRVDRTVRLRRPLAPLTEAFKASFVARFRARRFGTDPRGLDRQFAAAIDKSPFPATLPAYNDLFVGADSTLWVQHSGLLEGQPGDGTLDWTLIGADGRWLGDLTMPPFFRPTAAGRDWLLGVYVSPSTPPEVRLYSLRER